MLKLDLTHEERLTLSAALIEQLNKIREGSSTLDEVDKKNIKIILKKIKKAEEEAG